MKPEDFGIGNRTIKFRAWDGTKILGWHPEFFYDPYPVTGYSGNFDYIEMPLMQHVGFRDKNGKEIYEGDIIEKQITKKSKKTSKMIKGGVKWTRVMIWDKEGKWNIQKPLSDTNQFIEIIGNVFENPELLNKLK